MGIEAQLSRIASESTKKRLSSGKGFGESELSRLRAGADSGFAVSKAILSARDSFLASETGGVSLAERRAVFDAEDDRVNKLNKKRRDSVLGNAGSSILGN